MHRETILIIIPSNSLSVSIRSLIDVELSCVDPIVNNKSKKVKQLTKKLPIFFENFRRVISRILKFGRVRPGNCY